MSASVSTLVAICLLYLSEGIHSPFIPGSSCSYNPFGALFSSGVNRYTKRWGDVLHEYTTNAHTARCTQEILKYLELLHF
jgi:hypothetical protein